MKQTILLFQLISLMGAIVSAGIILTKEKTNDQLIVLITLYLVFVIVGTGFLMLGEKLFKKPTTW